MAAPSAPMTRMNTHINSTDFSLLLATSLNICLIIAHLERKKELKLYLDIFALGFGCLEQLFLFEAKHLRKRVIWEGFQAVVVRCDHVVVMLPCVCNLALGSCQFLLQLQKVLVCLQFRVVFRDCKE